jgi:hypothetical protein
VTQGSKARTGAGTVANPYLVAVESACRTRGWATGAEVAAILDISTRECQQHLARFADRGLVERWSPFAASGSLYRKAGS